MSVIGYRRMVIVLLAALALLAGWLWHLGWKLNIERLDAKAAWSVIMDYDRTRSKLSAMGVDDEIAYLVVYAHANSATGNRSLSLIMEREKARMIGDIVADLRKKTGEDLGDDPEKWIQKHSRAASKKRE